MRKVNLNEIKEEAWQSTGGKYAVSFKGISEALGRGPNSLDLSKRHPFDQWELYLVVSGRGSVRDKDGITEVGPGDAFLFQPGEAHQLSNAGNEDFIYYVIADNPRSGATGDSCFYPDSGKWAVVKEGLEEVIVKGTEADYFDGEE